MQLIHLKNLVIIICTILAHSSAQGMAAPTYDKIASSIESNDLKQLKKIQFYPLSKDLILNLLELAVCRRNHEAVEYIVSNNVLPLNKPISRLQDPRNSDQKVEFTLLETALIYHEDAPDKVNAPIIQLLLINGAKITPYAKSLAALPEKKSILPLLSRK